MTIPNLITIGRIFLVPIIVWLIIIGEPVTAFVLFVIAGISDGVDGFLARQFNMRSVLGGYLDPVADKALLVSIYVALSMLGEIPAWVTIAVVSRDLLIIGGVVLAWMVDHPIGMAPRLVSKVNTAAQITLAAVVLGDLAFVLGLDDIRLALIYVVGVSTFLSAAVYVFEWVTHMSAGDNTLEGPGT